MNPADFIHPAGTLVSDIWNDQPYLAFVPNPLPPVLEYDRELIKTLIDARSHLSELSGIGRTISNPRLLTNPFLRQEAVLSSRIEGTHTDMLGLYVYEAGQLPLFEDDKNRGNQQNDAQEVYNYVTALNFGLDALKQKPLSLNLLRDMHAILMNDVRGGKALPGEFRRIQNYISSGAGKLDTARYVPPPVRELTSSLDAFEKYVHAYSEEDPLVRLAWLHYQFEAIHPFLDGNGRIGRLLIALLLVEWKLLPAPLLYLSAFFERHRSTYYDLLLAVSQKSAWRDWTLFFLQGVSAQSLAAVHAAKRLQDIERDWRQRVQNESTVRITPRVVEMLFESPVISARIIQERHDISQPTANAAIHELERMGILKPFRGGMRSGWYVAADLLSQDE